VNRAFVILGSNIEGERNMREAVRRLSLHCRLVAVSPVYETAPVGKTDQPDFLNAAALIETDLAAAELKVQVLRVIEAELGRVRTEDKNAPRTIDLDIAIFVAWELETGAQRVWDPDILRYAHVAVPLADIAPHVRHPVTGQTLQEVAQSLPRTGLVSRPDIELWPKTVNKPKRRGTMSQIVEERARRIRPSDFDVFRNELLDVPDEACSDDIECATRDILQAIGEDVDREGLLDTPARVARAYAELTAGYHVDPVRLINDAVFDVNYDEMVIVRDIDYYSLCEHHLLPFLGQIDVGYIPDGKVIGLSKIPRIVEMFARRLQVQERLTQEIAEFLDETLNPLGVAVVAEGLHMCAAMRGVKKANARMVTSAMRGTFKEKQTVRNEFFGHIGREHVGF
jgi:GTP cyclohydrolase I